MNNLFEALLKIKTSKKNHLIKAVFVPNSTVWGEWTYYLYYYDMVHNTFYVNDLDYVWVEDRASAINIIEQIINRAYKQEMDAFIDIIKQVQCTKNPSVFYFYRQKITNIVIIDKVQLTPIRDRNWKIKGFKNPSWDNSSSEKVKLNVE
jgi:hypothetical protein